MNPTRTVAPTGTPVSVAELQSHLRVDSNDDVSLVEMYLNAAIEHLDGAGGMLGRAIMPQTWTETFPAWAERFRLAVAPVTAIGSVTYRDVDGAVQTVSATLYLIDSDDVVFLEDFDPPQLEGGPRDIVVTYTAGYTTVPRDLRVAILMLAAQMYDHRAGAGEAPVTENPGLAAMLAKYRRGWAA